ncbi:MAG: PAS domain-containing protein [Methylobacter sp.]
MKPRGVLIVLLLVGTIWASPGFVNAEQPLHVGSKIGFPPYTDVDAQGHSTGFAAELFSTVAEVMNIPAIFHPGEWDTVWQNLKTGKIDALPLAERTPEREGQVEFTRPHTIGYDSFFVRNGSPSINFIEQARAKSIIVLRSDAAHEALASRGFGSQLVIVDDLSDGFRLLASGQHDAVLAPLLQGTVLVNKIGLDKVITHGSSLQEYRREFCFAVRKGNTELRDRLDQGLAVVKANGEYDRLYRKWLGLYDAPTFPVKYVIWAALAAASLFALMGLWNWQLRRQVALRTAELAQAYTAVKAERQRLHDVLQSLPAYVVLLDQDYQIAFANRFFEHRYGKANGRRCYEYLFNRNEPCEVCETFKVFKCNKALDWRWTGPDDRDYEIHDFPFTDTDGSQMVMEVGFDITEMNRAKQALREANASLEQRVAERTAELEVARQEAEQARDLVRITMDNAPALMAYIGPDCRYRHVNKKYQRWFGYSDEQVLGHHMREVLGEASWKIIEAYVQKVLDGAQVNVEYQLPYIKGGPRWVHVTYSPDLDAEGNVRGFVVHVLDISERKRTADALKEIDQRKDEFLAMLAHELRNPLAPISNAIHIMKLPSPNETQLAWCRDVISRQVEHMVRLVDDLLDVSRISRGKIELKKEPLEVSAIVQRAVETSQPLIDAHHHNFTVNLPPEPLYVEGDPVRLSQAVSNLLNNAAKYTDEGGRIELTVESMNNDILFRVRDNGRGIDSSALSGLFQLFYQVDRTIDRAEGGLGIGLALVKSLVAMHGGDVWAQSEGRSKGSEFVIRLPSMPLSTSVPALCQLNPTPAEGSLRILVVDDNLDAAQSLSMLLTSKGHTASLAHDGYQALEVAQVERPQVMLLDIGLPGMDGYAIARTLRLHPTLKTTHLIALSGYGRQEDLELAKTAGFNGYLVKPVNFDKLQSALDPVIMSGQEAPQSGLAFITDEYTDA